MTRAHPPPAAWQDGAGRAVQYLRDGSFLDASTAGLALRLVTYNPQLDVIGCVQCWDISIAYPRVLKGPDLWGGGLCHCLQLELLPLLCRIYRADAVWSPAGGIEVSAPTQCKTDMHSSLYNMPQH